ncbi:DNA/RNA non-specific endonuclease [Sporosarcina psychrophila]
METWLQDLEGIFDSGLTDIHFQTENWGALTSKNTLKTDLVYRTTSIGGLSTILDIESQMTTMLQTFLAGTGPIQFGYGGFINIESPFVGTDMIALSCTRPEGNGTEQEKINVKKNSNILQDLADLGIGAVRSIPSFFTGDFGSKVMEEAGKIAPRQSKSFENMQRISNRTTNSALLGLPAQLEKNVTGVDSSFHSQRKFGEGGGTDVLADMLGYLVPGVGTVKAIRGTTLGAKGLTTGVSARNIKQLAKEGAAVGGVMSGVEVGGRELLNPEDTSWEQNALEIGLNVGAGAALDPLISLSVPIAKSVQKMLNDKSIINAVNQSSKTGEGIPIYQDVVNSSLGKIQNQLDFLTNTHYQLGTPNALTFNMPFAKTDIPTSIKSGDVDVKVEVKNVDVGGKGTGKGNIVNEVKEIDFGKHKIKGENGKKQLLPITKYVTNNNYKYTTDELGSIVNVNAPELVLKKADRNKYAQANVGGKDRLPDDDGGHLIGAQFNGPPDIDNLVPQNSQINRRGGVWYEMETEWANALKEIPPKKVSISIDPIYSNNSMRPDSFMVEYEIEGQFPVIREIANKSGG